MDKSKVISIVFLLIILAVGFIAYQFYTEKNNLQLEADSLSRQNSKLVEENSGLQYKFNKLEGEKKELESRWQEVSNELSRLESESDEWEGKYKDMVRERDMLVEKLKEHPKVAVREKPTSMPSAAGGASDEYWIDIVRAKAELEANLEKLNRELIDAKTTAAQLDKSNKELSLKVDEITNDKERLTQEISFRKRSIDIMSRDLVKEREERRNAIEELKKLRRDNVGLKRELILANKEKMQMQTTLKDTLEKKESLESKIAVVSNILKEKSQALQDLEDQLTTVVKEGKRISSREPTSVELPPIVVKPEVSGVKGLRGEIIAVNQDEKFVVIDIGESSGVRPGIKMSVLRGDREIGVLEIIETRRDISAADIKEVLGGFSIQEGDVAISR